MKKYLLPLLFILIFGISNAQESTSSGESLRTNAAERDFYIDKQLDLYKLLPSTLSLWTNGDWSSIAFNGTYENGDFKTVDDFKTDQKVAFKTESVQTLAEKKIKFYGNFTYHTAKHEEADWNLFYQKSEVGSPFRMVTDRMGDWRTKHYGVNGIITKQVSNRLHIGLSAKYAGDLYFRVVDTRNEQFNLTLDFQASASYKIQNHQYLSMGISYHRKKSEPQYSNKFKVNGSEYYPYTSTGLGDFEDQEGLDELLITDQNPSFLLAYHAGNKNKFSASYSFYPGKEEWKYYITSVDSPISENLYKYEYQKHDFTLSHLVNSDQFQLLSLVRSELITGQGYKFRTTYQDSYIYDGIKLNASLDLLRKKKRLFEHSALELGMENISKKDMVYAQLMEYMNLTIMAKTNFNFAINQTNKLQCTLNGGYRYNLSHTHDVASAASKPYTLNIAYNEMAYHTANYYKAGIGLSWFRQYKKVDTQWTFNYQYTAPTDIKIENNYSLLEKSTKRDYIGINFTLIF
jgi:hypothetical protein